MRADRELAAGRRDLDCAFRTSARHAQQARTYLRRRAKLLMRRMSAIEIHLFTVSVLINLAIGRRDLGCDMVVSASTT
jgi:hypothetical protein